MLILSGEDLYGYFVQFTQATSNMCVDEQLQRGKLFYVALNGSLFDPFGVHLFSI